MKLSLFTVSFAGLWGQHQLSLEESIDKTAELGFDGIEIMAKRPHFSPLDYSIDDCKRLAERLQKNNLELAAIAAYTNFTGGMEAAEVPFADFQIANIEALAERTQVLGGDLIRIFTSYERDDIPFAVQWRKTVQAIRECCDRAANHGVTIGVQNHHDIGVDTKSFAELIAQVDRPNITAMYDCWSVNLRGEDIAIGVKQMAPQMRFTTVADYVLIPRSRYQPDLVNYKNIDPPFAMAVPFGEGELDYKTFFNTLKACNFDGWVSYEMCSPIRDGGNLKSLEQYAKTFCDYMQPLRTAHATI